MAKIGLILAFVAILAFTVAAKADIGFPEGFMFDKAEGFHQINFVNLLDHFNPGNDQTFVQRFWYNAEHFEESSGPIFLYICGEYECSVREDRMFPFELAKEHKPLFFYLEHRYYGASHPFETLETENLRYLTSRHALADLAVFLTYANEKVVKDFGGEKRKVIVVGGSYPGAMSAWFRLKYPHIADAAWASSAVVNAFEDFDLFDYQVYNSTMRDDSSCTQVIQEMTQLYDEYAESSDRSKIEAVKDAFGAGTLRDDDFANYFADLFVGAIQYSNRTGMCKVVDSLKDTPNEERFAKIAEALGDSHDALSYDRAKLKDPTIVVADNSRAWTYQYCTEFGYFMIPYKEVHMRSKLLERQFWDGLCQDVFGLEIKTLADLSNVHYGSTEMAGTNIFFTNGGEDPWQWAGVRSSTPRFNNVARVMQCEDCGHCVEMYTEKDEDSSELRDVRKQLKEWVRIVLYGNLE
jgi:pimeloyl-ACP methyl ester carboxylesterase